MDANDVLSHGSSIETDTTCRVDRTVPPVLSTRRSALVAAILARRHFWADTCPVLGNSKSYTRPTVAYLTSLSVQPVHCRPAPLDNIARFS